MATSPDIRQSQTRILQDQLNAAATVQMDSVLASINNELTPPGRLIAQITPSLVVTVGTGTVVNPNTSKNRLIPFISNTYVNFAGGTITFPSGTGTITVSPGVNLAITIGASQFLAITVQLDSTGQLNLFAGTATSSLATALAAASPGSSSFLSLGLIVIQTNGSSVIQSVTNSMIYQFGSGTGGSGSGSSGLGDDLASLQYRGSLTDLFAESPTQSSSTVNNSAAFTNASYNAGKAMYAVSYDASKTGTSTGTAFTLSGTPAFTVVAGDVVVNQATGEVKKITVVTTQTSYTLESAFTANMAAGAATVSQAVHTKDIYNITVDTNGNTLASAFPALSFSDVSVFYKDNSTAGSNQWAIDTAANVSYVGSPDNSTWTIKQSRVTNVTDTYASTTLPSAGTSLYLRFFSAKTSGTGVVNLIMYKAYVQKSTSSPTGGVQWSAYGTTNNSTTPINCTIGVSGGKTTITLTNGNTYAMGVNPTQTYGTIDILANGQLFPRFVAGSVPATDGYYTEVSPTVIQLDRDYSSQQIDIQIIQRTQTIDASTTNTSSISVHNETFQNGFQGFTNQNTLMAPTTSTGTPVAGSFYSSITGRASIVDLSQDLKPRMGIERISTQQVYLLQNEFGPSGEQVWATPNDLFGQIRFIGTWATQADTAGAGPQCGTIANLDSVEVTFYGTGLNVLLNSNGPPALSYSVDGAGLVAVSIGAETNIIGARNYAPNKVQAVVAGLTLGVHTVRLQSTSSVAVRIYGFETLTEATTLKVTPGISYVNGSKLTTSALTSPAFNSSFESGTLGTTGGRVVIYQKADGSIAKAVQPVGSQQNLTSASHTLEEVVRTYSPREFGAGRADDFSSTGFVGGGNSNLAFTLEDGTTTLVGSNVRNSIATLTEGGVQLGANASYWILTFVGTGLDVVRQDDGTTAGDNYQYFVDGTSIGNVNTSNTATGKTYEKVVSGLPYGTHTVKLLRNSAVASSRAVYKFIVYQPKKPAIPAGAVELADYNVMANYVANTTASQLNIAQGVLRKELIRETAYINSWIAVSLDVVDFTSGQNIGTATTNGTFQYTFFGTGFEHRFFADAVALSGWTYTVDGITNLSGAGYTTSVYGAGLSFNAATGTLTGTGTGTIANGVSVSGLPLGIHTLSVKQNGTTGKLYADALDIITPIHSAKPNLFSDLQNSLPIGSCAISDNRKITPVKDVLPVTKAWAQAVGIQSSPTTTSTTLVPVPDLSCTVKTLGGPIRIFYSVDGSQSAISNFTVYQVFVDGVAVGTQKFDTASAGGQDHIVSDTVKLQVSPGVHKVDLYWRVSGGTGTQESTSRNLVVEET